jgi:hemolysin III
MRADANHVVHEPTDAAPRARERVAVQARELLHEVKPKLRGWSHALGAPVALLAGIVLVIQAPGPTVRLGVAGFVATTVALFGVSALYHRRTWSPRIRERLRQIDHANIFVHIAGTSTAFSLLFLEPDRAALLLKVVWIGAGAGVLFRVLWMDAPRWLHVPPYVAVGGAALLFLKDAQHTSAAPLALMVIGGVLYLIGGVVYGFQRPDPLPRWFGFHEVFHAFTVAAFAAHFLGIFLATSTAA